MLWWVTFAFNTQWATLQSWPKLCGTSLQNALPRPSISFTHGNKRSLRQILPSPRPPPPPPCNVVRKERLADESSNIASGQDFSFWGEHRMLVNKEFVYRNSNRNSGIEKWMAHFKSTFTTIERFSEILKCCLLWSFACWDSDSHFSLYTVCRTNSMFLHTARFSCIPYPEICLNATLECIDYLWTATVGSWPCMHVEPFHSWEWSMSKFPCSLTRNMTSHSMKNLTFHSLLGWKVIILQILATSLIQSLFERLGEYTFWAQEGKG